MGSTFLSIHLHVVFSTKNRLPLIRDAWRPQLHRYLGGTVRGLAAVPEAIGGVADHMHLLIGFQATHRLADFMRELKKASSLWITESHSPGFAWQEGYSAFSVSATHVQALKKYIATQDAHHHKLDFATELKNLLNKNGISFDPKYLL